MTHDEQWLLEEKYDGEKTLEYKADIERLAKGEPLAYVIGYQPFLSLRIYLDSKPLIPRVETEWWTEKLLNAVAVAKDESASRNLTVRLGQAARSDGLADESQPRFLDLCAGSGAIGCAALAQLSDVQVYFGEIDPAHESTILKNIRENKLEEPASPKTSSRGGSRATIGIGDLFQPFGDMRFDVIAANPPYLPVGRPLPQSVADFEPSLALTAGADGLDIIRRIALTLPKHLAKGGVAWIECDSAHASDACALFVAQGLRAEIRTDQYGAQRIICICG